VLIILGVIVSVIESSIFVTIFGKPIFKLGEI